MWLIWRSGNGFGHVNKVKLRRARPGYCWDWKRPLAGLPSW